MKVVARLLSLYLFLCGFEVVSAQEQPENISLHNTAMSTNKSNQGRRSAREKVVRINVGCNGTTVSKDGVTCRSNTMVNEECLAVIPAMYSVTTPCGQASFLCSPCRVCNNVSSVRWRFNGEFVDEHFYKPTRGLVLLLALSGYGRECGIPENAIEKYGARTNGKAGWIYSEFVERSDGNFGAIVVDRIPNSLNGTVIDCVAEFSSGKHLISNPVVLYLQGMLDAPVSPRVSMTPALVLFQRAEPLGSEEVADCTVKPFHSAICSASHSAIPENSESQLSVSWVPPYTLPFAYAAPDIYYCVAVIGRRGRDSDVDAEDFFVIHSDSDDTGDVKYSHGAEANNNLAANERLLVSRCDIDEPDVQIVVADLSRLLCADGLNLRITPRNVAGIGTSLELPLSEAVLPSGCIAAVGEPGDGQSFDQDSSGELDEAGRAIMILASSEQNEILQNVNPDSVHFEQGMVRFSDQTSDRDNQPYRVLMLLPVWNMGLNPIDPDLNKFTFDCPEQEEQVWVPSSSSVANTEAYATTVSSVLLSVLVGMQLKYSGGLFH